MSDSINDLIARQHPEQYAQAGVQEQTQSVATDGGQTDAQPRLNGSTLNLEKSDIEFWVEIAQFFVLLYIAYQLSG